MEMFFKVLVLANVLLFNLAINLYNKCVKASQVTREGIASNPGPRNYTIKKSLLPSDQQGHSRYGDSAGMQCTSIAYLTIIFSAVKRVVLWKSLDLDIVLAQGNELFIHLLWMNCAFHFHLRVVIFPAKDFPRKVISLLIGIIYLKSMDFIIVTREEMVQYLPVVDLVLPQYGVCIHFSFLIPTVAIFMGLMILIAEHIFEFRSTMSLNNFIKSCFENFKF